MVLIVDSNLIKEDGCKNILSAPWEDLKRIDLCKNLLKIAFNNVKHEGCYYLSKKKF